MEMKKVYSSFLFLFVLFFFLQPAYSQTFVSGIINSNTTWDLAGSPYVVTSTVTVQPGVTLTIDPGVVVKIDGFFDDINVELKPLSRLMLSGFQ